MAPEPSSKSSEATASSAPSRPPSAARTLALVIGALLLAAASCEDPVAEPNTPDRGVVDFVIDGDTVDLVISDSVERVRLIGIDTPESVSRDVPVQCFGPEASAALTGLLPPGTEVMLERDAEARDRFGRLLLYVRRAADGLFVNRWMVEQGFADVLFIEPNTTFEADFTRARNEARADEVGLWGSCDGPEQPLE